MKLKIEKLIFGGQGLSRTSRGVVLCWNALPGEEVYADVERRKGDFSEATATEILKPSPLRVKPKEDHYLSCGPWQIITWAGENEWKKKITLETLEKIGGITLKEEPEIISDPSTEWNYRNKMDYFVMENKQGKPSLAFFKRGTDELIAVDHCELATAEVNRAAKKVLDWINKSNVPIKAIKRMVVRNEGAKAMVSLILKEEFPVVNYPLIDNDLSGFHVYPSRGLEGEEVSHIFTQGEKYLSVKIRDVSLRYGALSFFQVNLPVFNKVLDDIAPFLSKDKDIVDYYCGVGAISLPLSKKFKQAMLVDSSPSSIKDARANIKENGVINCQAEVSAAERAVEHITADKIVIFDPPRAGLHRNIIERVIDVKPERIIYLSCNISSQARDLKKTLPHYEVKFYRVYNFFPKTPHIEGLCVLDRV